MRENKEVSVVNAEIIGDGINGVFWVLFGIFQFFDNLPCIILSIIFIVCAAVISIYNLVSKKEKEDEMARANIEKARNIVLLLWIMILAIIGTISIFTTITVNIRYIFPFMLGMTEFLICCFFIHYEKVGD